MNCVPGNGISGIMFRKCNNLYKNDFNLNQNFFLGLADVHKTALSAPWNSPLILSLFVISPIVI